MKNDPQQQVYVAFLRGINVGGHHKVPMAALRATLEAAGFSEVKTLLNSGNVVFKAGTEEENVLQDKVATHLQETFHFPIPVLIRKMEDMQQVIASNPYKDVEIHKDVRLYVTFLKAAPIKNPVVLPWLSSDKSFQILANQNRMIFSVLDVSKYKTTDAMKVLEKYYSQDITTRNWNTLVKITQLAP